jgi:hypothetical protein
MFRYYCRAVRQACRNLIRMGKPQVIGALLAFGIFICQLILRVIPNELAWSSFKSVAWPYCILIIALIAIAVIQAPAQLDSRRAKRILLLRTSSRNRIDRIQSANIERFAAMQASVEAAQQENAELKRPRRSPHQQALYDDVQQEISGIDENDRAYLHTLLRREQMELFDLHNDLAKRQGIPEEAISKSRQRFMKYSKIRVVEDIHPTPFKPHNYVRINPHCRDVLLELLHSSEPVRPVTPPPV